MSTRETTKKRPSTVKFASEDEVWVFSADEAIHPPRSSAVPVSHISSDETNDKVPEHEISPAETTTAGEKKYADVTKIMARLALEAQGK